MNMDKLSQEESELIALRKMLKIAEDALNKVYYEPYLKHEHVGDDGTHSNYCSAFMREYAFHALSKIYDLREGKK